MLCRSVTIVIPRAAGLFGTALDVDLVARDLAAREQHHITAHKFERVFSSAIRARAARCPPLGRKYQQIAAQAHCIEIDRVGKSVNSHSPATPR